MYMSELTLLRVISKKKSILNREKSTFFQLDLRRKFIKEVFRVKFSNLVKIFLKNEMRNTFGNLFKNHRELTSGSF